MLSNVFCFARERAVSKSSLPEGVKPLPTRPGSRVDCHSRQEGYVVQDHSGVGGGTEEQSISRQLALPVREEDDDPGLNRDEFQQYEPDRRCLVGNSHERIYLSGPAHSKKRDREKSVQRVENHHRQAQPGEPLSSLQTPGKSLGSACLCCRAHEPPPQDGRRVRLRKTYAYPARRAQAPALRAIRISTRMAAGMFDNPLFLRAFQDNLRTVRISSTTAALPFWMLFTGVRSAKRNPSRRTICPTETSIAR